MTEMIEKLNTTVQFTMNLFTTGAFKETSRKVEIEICSKLPQAEEQVVVEYGLGHGNLTREILSKISPTSRLYAFEVNEEFCEHVSNDINDDRLIIINDSAEHLFRHIDAPVNGFVSSIPLTFFSKEMRERILKNSYQSLKPEGYFSQVLYSRVHQRMLKNTFDRCSVSKNYNLPMEYVFHCQKLAAS